MLDFIMTAFMSLIVAFIMFQFFNFIKNIFSSSFKSKPLEVRPIDDLIFEIDSNLNIKIDFKFKLKSILKELFEIKDRINSLKTKMENTLDYKYLVTEINIKINYDYEKVKNYYIKQEPVLGSIYYDDLKKELDQIKEALDRIPKEYFIDELVVYEDVATNVLANSLTNNANNLKDLLNSTLITEEDKILVQKQLDQINSYLTKQKDTVENTSIEQIRNDLQINQKYLDSLEIFWLK